MLMIMPRFYLFWMGPNMLLKFTTRFAKKQLYRHSVLFSTAMDDPQLAYCCSRFWPSSYIDTGSYIHDALITNISETTEASPPPPLCPRCLRERVLASPSSILYT